MSNQNINADNDIIENVVEASWQRGVCVPEWTTPPVLLLEDSGNFLLEDGSKLILG